MSYCFFSLRFILFSTAIIFFIQFISSCNQQKNKSNALSTEDDSINIVVQKVEEFRKNNPYPIDKFIPKSKQDSLLADIVTYIYIRPSEATAENRFEKRFRQYYVKQLILFEWIYYTVKDNTHYFYLKRPARSPKGYKRGVGGKFKLNEKNEIIDFEEIFNTPTLPELEIFERGKQVFEEILETGSLGKFKDNLAYHEFPGKISRYDKKIYEWVIK